MGEKLAAFVREVLRQRELLNDAMERDDVAVSLMREDEIGRRKREGGRGHRRIWTRRDKRLLDAGYENGPGCPRTERILERLRPERGEGPYVPLLRAALDETRCEGTFSHLAPILEALADAHEGLFNHATEITYGQLGSNMRYPYSRVQEAFDEAVNRVMPYLPPESVRFDKEYPWDGRHESRVLYRDLCQPVDEAEHGWRSPGAEGSTSGEMLRRQRTADTASNRPTTTVFVSYAHSSPEHMQAVASLAETLRENGLTVRMDTDVRTPQGPEEGWPKWMKRQIKEADWVLMLFDRLYRRRFDGDEEPGTGLGATWEGAIITHHFYSDSARNTKFIPLLADGTSADLIPTELLGYTHYFIPKQAVELAVALWP
jgi:hypothetical protein